MPRLGVSVNNSFATHNRPDRYGRRVRYVNGVDYFEPKERSFSLFVKLAMALTLIASLAMPLAVWKLFNFPH